MEPAEDLREVLRRQLEGTRRRSRKIWQSIPEEKSLWRPEGAVLTIAEVVRHVADADQFWANAVSGDLYRGVDQASRPVTSLAQEVALAESRRKEVLELIRTLPAGEFRRMVEIPKYNLRQEVTYIFTRLADHEAHHRGQLIVYLRSGGLAVPFIWD
jgi:uncharacterized damage-inducible protein DinB